MEFAEHNYDPEINAAFEELKEKPEIYQQVYYLLESYNLADKMGVSLGDKEGGQMEINDWETRDHARFAQRKIHPLPFVEKEEMSSMYSESDGVRIGFVPGIATFGGNDCNHCRHCCEKCDACAKPP